MRIFPLLVTFGIVLSDADPDDLERLAFDLPDSFPGDIQHRSDLLQGPASAATVW